MNLKLLFEAYKNKFESQSCLTEHGIIPITLVFQFSREKIWAHHNSDNIITRQLLSPEYAIDLNLTYETGFDFSLLEQDFKQHAKTFGFPSTKRSSDSESEFFWLGYEDHPDFDSKINFEETLTEKLLVNHIANSIARQFDHIHLHKWMKVDKKFKVCVLYWGENLECIYLNYSDLSSEDSEEDFDVELNNRFYVEFSAWHKNIMNTRDEDDESFNYFEVLEEQIIWEVEDELSKKLKGHPLFKKGFKLGSCLHDIQEFEDLYRDFYEDEEDEEDD